MGTDYYSYIIAGVFANKYIHPKEYEEKTPSYVEIKGKKVNIYFEDGKPIFSVKPKVGWEFNNRIYKIWDKLEEALDLLGLSLVTQSCECEIWEGDTIGLIISECDGSAVLSWNLIEEKLKNAEDILKSIGIDEKPQIINILHIDY